MSDLVYLSLLSIKHYIQNYIHKFIRKINMYKYSIINLSASYLAIIVFQTFLRVYQQSYQDLEFLA